MGVEVSRRKFLGLVTLGGAGILLDSCGVPFTQSKTSAAPALTAVIPSSTPTTEPTGIPKQTSSPTPIRTEAPTPQPTTEPTPQPTPEPSPEIVKFNPSDIVYYGDRTKPYIYLTIDDCYDKKAVETALDIAKDLQVRLTFFPIGNELAKGPASLWKRAIDEGHAIENHSQNHLWLPNLTDDGIRSQIELQRKTVESILGKPYKQRFFRPSGGGGILGRVEARIPNIARELGYKIAMWSADSGGPKYYPKTDTATEDTIVNNISKNMSNGVIVLQHAISDDVLALPQIIRIAKARGFKCITMQEGLS